MKEQVLGFLMLAGKLSWFSGISLSILHPAEWPFQAGTAIKLCLRHIKIPIATPALGFAKAKTLPAIILFASVSLCVTVI